MATSKHYTHIEMERYLQKKMTQQEMHDFEKAMLEDPFLADAMEGFMKSDLVLADQHLQQIEKEVYGKKEKARIVPIKPTSRIWRMRAAVIILLAGLGIASFYLLNDQVKTAQITETTPFATPPVTDTLVEAEKQAPKPMENFDSEQPLIAATKPRTAKKNKEAIADASVSDDGVKTFDNETARGEEAIVSLYKKEEAKEMNSRAARSMAKQEMSKKAPQAAKGFEIKGKVTDEAGEPVGFATLSTSRGQGTVADAKGNFNLISTDSVTSVEVNSIGYLSEKVRVDQHANNLVRLKEESQSLAEIVVSQMKKNKEQKNARYDHLNNSTTVFPVDGWPSYHDYLENSVKQMNDTLVTELHGKVELEFNVDDNGRPQKISIKKSADPHLNPHAIQILNDGADWQSTRKNKKGYLVIIF